MAENAAPEFRFGEGKISGVLSATLGVFGFCALICMLYPEWITTGDMRAIYPMDWVRALIQLVLASAFALGVLNTILNRRPRSAGMAGMLLSVFAMLLGGAEVRGDAPDRDTTWLGLDWFILNLFFLALVFVPLERIFAKRPEQRIFRPGWRTGAFACDVDQAISAVRAVGLGIVAPGPGTTVVAARGRLPLRLGGQRQPGPPRVGIGVKPVDSDHGEVGVAPGAVVPPLRRMVLVR